MTRFDKNRYYDVWIRCRIKMLGAFTWMTYCCQGMESCLIDVACRHRAADRGVVSSPCHVGGSKASDIVTRWVTYIKRDRVSAVHCTLFVIR